MPQVHAEADERQGQPGAHGRAWRGLLGAGAGPADEGQWQHLETSEPAPLCAPLPAVRLLSLLGHALGEACLPRQSSAPLVHGIKS